MSKSRTRWLQWSTADLQNGLGGVEVHARSLKRELELRGIECTLSKDISDFDGDWDVILTHGSAPGPRGNRRAVRAHVLHGTTLGRMAACGEWSWPGGYLAAARELKGILQSDVVFSVNPQIFLLELARKLGKKAAYCNNGWDAGDSVEGGSVASLKLPAELGDRFWIFVGRGDDRMKGVDFILPALELLPDIRVAAAPGAGFEFNAKVVKTGKLDSTQVRALMARARGLLIPSRYEGHSLVVLEALSSGIPIVATSVGGIPYLPPGIQGLKVIESTAPESIVEAISQAEREFPADEQSRRARSSANQRLLPRWSDVAEADIKAIEEFRQGR